MIPTQYYLSSIFRWQTNKLIIWYERGHTVCSVLNFLVRKVRRTSVIIPNISSDQTTFSHVDFGCGAEIVWQVNGQHVGPMQLPAIMQSLRDRIELQIFLLPRPTWLPGKNIMFYPPMIVYFVFCSLCIMYILHSMFYPSIIFLANPATTTLLSDLCS